jgi:UDP-N-acetylglucosamine 3-dehydrogenase
MEKLKTVVVGLGSMGKNHVRVLSLLPEIELVGLVDGDGDAAAELGKQYQCPHYASTDELPSSDIDYAVVAVPNRAHKQVTIDMLSRGAHVLVEKPIAPTIADAEAMIVKASDVDRLLMVGHVERFNPAVLAAIKGLGQDTAISVSIARVGPFPPRMSDVGVVIDLAVHDIDIIRTIAKSEITSVSAELTSVKATREDTALMQFRTENGVLASINTNWITPFKLRQLQIATANKFIVADLITRQVSEYSDYKADGSYVIRQMAVSQKEPLMAQHEASIAAIRSGASGYVSGADGLRNLEVALQCLRVGGFQS